MILAPRLLKAALALTFFVGIPLLSGQEATEAERIEELRTGFALVAAGANTDPVIRVTENGLELVISNPSDTRRTYPTMWRESLFSSSPPHLRASELGVLPISRREAHLSIRAGTVVIADAFDLNEETSQVIATGDAIVEVWRESDVVARVTANRVTIGEPTR